MSYNRLGGHRREEIGTVRSITAKVRSTCGTCEEPIRPGQAIRWCIGVLAWHSSCAAPRSLQTFVTEARKAAGLT